MPARTKRDTDPTPIEHARKLGKSVLANPLTDDQAIELMKAFTTLGAVEGIPAALHRIAAALEGLVDAVAPFTDAVTAERLTSAARTLAELHANGVEDSKGNEPVPTAEQSERILKQRREEFEAGVKERPLGGWDSPQLTEEFEAPRDDQEAAFQKGLRKLAHDTQPATEFIYATPTTTDIEEQA